MRRLGRLGVWCAVDRLDGAGIKRLLRTVEDLGYSALWHPEALGYESLSIAGFMLANTTPAHNRQLDREHLRPRPLHRQTRAQHLVEPL